MTAGGTSASAAAPVWVERKTPEGKRFYYNRNTKERTWRRPPELQGKTNLLPPAELQGKANMLVAKGAPAGHAQASSGKQRDEMPDRCERDATCSPNRQPAGGDADSGRGIAPDVGDSPNTGPSSGRIGFVMDEDGYWLRVDEAEDEYLTADEMPSFAGFRHSFVIREPTPAPADVDPQSLINAIAALPAPPALGSGRRRRPSAACAPAAAQRAPLGSSSASSPPHSVQPASAPAAALSLSLPRSTTPGERRSPAASASSASAANRDAPGGSRPCGGAAPMRSGAAVHQTPLHQAVIEEEEEWL